MWMSYSISPSLGSAFETGFEGILNEACDDDDATLGDLAFISLSVAGSWSMVHYALNNWPVVGTSELAEFQAAVAKFMIQLDVELIVTDAKTLVEGLSTCM